MLIPEGIRALLNLVVILSDRVCRPLNLGKVSLLNPGTGAICVLDQASLLTLICAAPWKISECIIKHAYCLKLHHVD